MYEVTVIIQKMEKHGRVYRTVGFADVVFWVRNVNSSSKLPFKTEAGGRKTVPLQEGMYQFVVDSIETFVGTTNFILVPLAPGETVNFNLINQEKQSYNLKRRLQSLINKGDEKSLDKAVQLLAQVKDTYHNYQEIPEFRKIAALETVLENKLLQNRMEERFAGNDGD
ncbi:MAG: hypothetical protein ABIQ93_12390 [Saprospiraceae bacterium]